MVVFISVYHTPVGIQQDIVEETAYLTWIFGNKYCV